MATLIQRGTGKRVIVPDESVEFWLSVGYSEEPKPKAPADEKPAPRARAAKK